MSIDTNILLIIEVFRAKEKHMRSKMVLFFKNKETRNRLIFTLVMLFVIRLGSNIPLPHINAYALLAGVSDNGLIGMMSMLGGGVLERFSLFSLGIGPYITASIIIQLLSMDVIAPLAEMARGGKQGKMKLDKITRYLGAVLAFIQAYSMTYAFHMNYGILTNPRLSTFLYIATVLTAGSLLIVWIGDRISYYGIGNGISMIIFAGIVSNLPWQFISAYQSLVQSLETTGIVAFALLVLIYVAIIVLVIFMGEAVRKIPIQYTSNDMHSGGKELNHLPLKINSANVTPVIFASAIMVAPVTFLSFFAQNVWTKAITNVLSFQKPVGLCIYAILVVVLAFFYTNMQIDPSKIADNLNKRKSYILGIRPGKDTHTYISNILNRITVLGALFLMMIAVLPHLLPMLIPQIPLSVSLGGTGIIIAVGVALETTKELESKLKQKAYHGFTKR